MHHLASDPTVGSYWSISVHDDCIPGLSFLPPPHRYIFSVHTVLYIMHLGLPKPLTASHPNHPLTHPSDSKAAKIKYLTAFLNTITDNHKPETPASPSIHERKGRPVASHNAQPHAPSHELKKHTNTTLSVLTQPSAISPAQPIPQPSLPPTSEPLLTVNPQIHSPPSIPHLHLLRFSSTVRTSPHPPYPRFPTPLIAGWRARSIDKGSRRRGSTKEASVRRASSWGSGWRRIVWYNHVMVP